MLRSLGFGLGLETFAKFLMISVSVSKNLVSKKSIGFGFGKFAIGKKVSVSVSEKFGLRKKSRFRKIWYQKKCLGIGYGQNFAIVIQCCWVPAVLWLLRDPTPTKQVWSELSLYCRYCKLQYYAKIPDL